MKKMITAILLAVTMLGISASAVSGTLDEVSYKVTGEGVFCAQFDVSVNDDAVAFVSVYDADGRLVGAKLVNVSEAQNGYSAEFDNLGDIAYAQVSVLENASSLKPVCEQKTVKNITSVGDAFIPVGPLFPG